VMSTCMPRGSSDWGGDGPRGGPKLGAVLGVTVDGGGSAAVGTVVGGKGGGEGGEGGGREDEGGSHSTEDNRASDDNGRVAVGLVAHHDCTHPCLCQPLHRPRRRTVRVPIHQVRGAHDRWRFRQVGLRIHAVGEEPPTCGEGEWASS
jgi:hypothetical protein